MRIYKAFLNKYINKIKSIDKSLRVILMTSMLSVTIMDMFLKEIPAPYKIMYSIGEIYYAMCLSYCASFVFYIVTVYMPQQRKKLSVYKHIHNKIYRITDLVERLLIGIKTELLYSDEMKVKIREIEKEQLREYCEKRDFCNEASIPFSTGKYKFENWFEVFNYVHINAKEYIKDLLFFDDCLSIEVVSLLTDIEDLFDHHINIRKGEAAVTYDKDIYVEHLWQLHLAIKNLNKYFEKDTHEIKKDYHKSFDEKVT